MKRLFDLIVAISALILLSPVLVGIALAVWLSSPGPALYRGVRVGRDGREFSILKFRSMRVASQTTTEITVHRDPRITAAGRFLRASKLDELPQLWNVVRGEMSLVGPRPEAQRYVARYTPEQREVLKVRPGLTGLTQIYFRDEERLLRGKQPERYYQGALLPAKLEIDRFYALHRTFWLDMKIIILTTVALFRPLTPPHSPPFTILTEIETAPQEAISGVMKRVR
jgi:lipopolysaccharide/colanic/teichoic acid biosynthesis glycosyltransferase